MFKIVTNGNKKTLLKLFRGFEEFADEWRMDYPTVFEHSKKQYDSQNYFVSTVFSSSLQKKYLLVFLKGGVDYYIRLRSYSPNRNYHTHLRNAEIVIYDWKNIDFDDVKSITSFSVNDENYTTISFQHDMYCLFECSPVGIVNSSNYIMDLDFYKNIPSGGNYNTRFFRDWDGVDGSKWSVSGKIYAQRNFRGLNSDVKIKNYDNGLLIYGGIMKNDINCNLSNFQEANLLFIPKKELIARNINDGINYFTDFQYIKVEGYIKSDNDTVAEFVFSPGGIQIVMSINGCYYGEDEKIISNENGVSNGKFNLKLKSGFNEIVVFIKNNGNSVINIIDRYFNYYYTVDRDYFELKKHLSKGGFLDEYTIKYKIKWVVKPLPDNLSSSSSEHENFNENNQSNFKIYYKTEYVEQRQKSVLYIGRVDNIDEESGGLDVIVIYKNGSLKYFLNEKKYHYSNAFLRENVSISNGVCYALDRYLEYTVSDVVIYDVALTEIEMIREGWI